MLNKIDAIKKFDSERMFLVRHLGYFGNRNGKITHFEVDSWTDAKYKNIEQIIFKMNEVTLAKLWIERVSGGFEVKSEVYVS